MTKEKEKEKKEINLEELQKQLEEYKKLNEEYLNGWKRERADFLNYKKDEMERIGQLIKYANEELILRILPILDNFFIAEKNIPEEMKKDGSTGSPQVSWAKGLLQIHQQFRDFLKSQGIEEIKAVGEKFNPNFHETIGDVDLARSDLAKSSESGIIVEETQKGYTLFGRVIRPAKVKVSK